MESVIFVGKDILQLSKYKKQRY